jgi:curli biogenesis system outer membrane secretion channel CsgG
MMKVPAAVIVAIITLLLSGCAKQEAAGPSPPSAAPATQKFNLSSHATPIPDVGGQQQVTVIAQGSGTTAGVAVQEAMELAILEVNGASIDAGSIAIKFGLDVAEGQTEAMLRGSAFAEAITRRSKGTLTGFRLLNMTDPPVPGGLYKAKIEASIARFRAPADSKKIRIFVAPLRFTARSFDFGGTRVPAEQIADLIRRQLIEALSSSGRFSVLDRDFGPELQGELDLIATGQTPNTEMGKLGEVLSADIVWVGTINELAYVRSARKLATSDRELVSYSGGWSVSERLLNVSTRQIMFSTSLQERAHATDPTTLDPGIDAVGAQQTMVFAIVRPITVLANDGLKVVLSQGGQSVKTGERYRVVLLGKEMADPQTQQSLGRIESPCCDVVIDSVASTMAQGHLENLRIAQESLDPSALQLRDEVRSSATVTPAPTPVKVRQKPASIDLKSAASPKSDAPGDENKKW